MSRDAMSARGDETLHRVRVCGLDVAYRMQGQGQPLVLLHGGLCDSRVWGRQIDDLSDEFTVVAWDAPGCGESSDPPESFRLPDYADVLAELMRGLGLDRAHVLGHSWGSSLALELGRRHPHTVASLVLAGGYAGWAGSLPADEVDRRLQSALELADTLPGYDAPSAVGTRAMAHAMAEADLRDALPGIEVPTLLLYGASDVRSTPEVAQALHAALRNSTLVFMPGLGHEAYAESPAVFDNHVRAFLTGVVGSASVGATHAANATGSAEQPGGVGDAR